MAELHSAFYWDCEKCGRENFVRAISGVLHLTPLMHKMLVDTRLIIQPEEPAPGATASEMHCRTHRVSLAPPSISCSFCGHCDLAQIEDTDTHPKLVSELPDIGNMDPAFADAVTPDVVESEHDQWLSEEEWDDEDEGDDDDDDDDDDWEDDDIDELEDDAENRGALQGGPFDWMFYSPFDDDEDDD